MMLTVFIGEVLAIYVLGMILLIALEKNRKYIFKANEKKKQEKTE